MGCIKAKAGDFIIVTSVLSINPHKDLKDLGLLFSKQKIEYVDSMGLPEYYPYKIHCNDRSFWVTGVLYSPVLEELF
jgi:hypothetical protein